MVLAAGDRAIAPGEPQAQLFTSSGTWTKPAGLRGAIVEVWGGGGGGGGTIGATNPAQGEGGGGGGGGYVRKLYKASELNSTEAVTVGAGGTVASGADGNAGGSSTFKGLTAGGGGGGSVMTSTTGTTVTLGGTRGSASGGDLNCVGSNGGNGRVFAGFVAFTNFGGPSPSGGGLTHQFDLAASNGSAGQAPGGGGSGSFSANTNFSGGVGAAGAVLITTYF
jgi:hypothetical protein